MRIEIEVSNEEVIVSQRGAYTFHEQPAYIYTYDRQGKKNQYPSPCKLSLKDNQPAFKKGMYVLKPDSVYVNRFGQVSIFPILEPVAAAAVAPVKSVA